MTDAIVPSAPPGDANEVVTGRVPTTPWLRRWRWFRTFFVRSSAGAIGVVLVAIAVIVAIAGPWIAPYGGIESIDAVQDAKPSLAHPFGVDGARYDVYSRVLIGGRRTVLIALAAIALGLTLGTVTGAVAGYFGGRTDFIVMRGVEILMAFPGILLAILVAAILGPSAESLVVAIGAATFPGIARQVRANVIEVRGADYCTASRAIGAGHIHILRRVVLPNCTGTILVLATLGLGTAILDVAGLYFLGLGGEVSDPEWGSMINTAWSGLHRAPHAVIFPGLAIGLPVLGFNLVGDALRDALDPRERHR
jgi:ABC-type dipeptide/oligopeptide/nickel transport system permease subunit